MRDGEVEILDSFMGLRAGLEVRGDHALQRLRKCAATGKGLWERAGDGGGRLSVVFGAALSVVHWPALPA